jgi:hypothetical protein
MSDQMPPSSSKGHPSHSSLIRTVSFQVATVLIVMSEVSLGDSSDGTLCGSSGYMETVRISIVLLDKGKYCVIIYIRLIEMILIVGLEVMDD